MYLVEMSREHFTENAEAFEAWLDEHIGPFKYQSESFHEEHEYIYYVGEGWTFVFYDHVKTWCGFEYLMFFENEADAVQFKLTFL
jgi:hypothetical protein